MDLANYSTRIGIDLAGQTPDIASLDRIIYAHQCSIPFEDIDIYDLHKGVSLDRDALFEKIIMRRRGGYCFELNALFCFLLRELGFRATACGFKVPDPEDGDIVNHRGTLVEIDGAVYFADVGLGGPMPPFAVPIDGTRKTGHGETYWIEPADDGWLALKRLRGSGILDETDELFAPYCIGSESLVGLFNRDEVSEEEFRAISEHMSVGENASFRKERLVNMRTPRGYRAIVGELFIEKCENGKMAIPVEHGLGQILADKFGIAVALPWV